MTKLTLAALAIIAMAGSAQAGATCRRAGGESVMLTEDLAKFMANAALKNALAAHKWKPQGAIIMKCDTAQGLLHCVARQKACG
jgi:hypothetical protein